MILTEPRAQVVQDATQAALHALPWATTEPGGQLVVDDGDALALQVCEAVPHKLQLIGRVSYPVQEFASPASSQHEAINGTLLQGTIDDRSKRSRTARGREAVR